MGLALCLLVEVDYFGTFHMLLFDQAISYITLFRVNCNWEVVAI
jgi:hypothetical protein